MPHGVEIPSAVRYEGTRITLGSRVVRQGGSEYLIQAMEPKHLIRAAIAVSVIGHMALAVGVMFADARQFDALPSQAIAIDIVRPEDVKPPEKDAKPPAPDPQKQEDPFRLPDMSLLDHKFDTGAQASAQKSAPQQSAPQQSAQQQASQAPPQSASQPPPSQQAASQPQQQQPQQQTSQQQSPPAQQQASLQQQALQQQASPPPEPPSQAQPAAAGGAEPDVTVKYGVMLGLPTGDGGSTAFTKADIAPLDIAAFRRHLKTCSSLPASVTPGDKVRIVMRAFLSPDGKLMGPPTLLEASASAKGPLLMQAAIKALEACQPYPMLPADKYKEWRVLDLAFTPPDFAG